MSASEAGIKCKYNTLLYFTGKEDGFHWQLEADADLLVETGHCHALGWGGYGVRVQYGKYGGKHGKCALRFCQAHRICIPKIRVLYPTISMYLYAE